MAALRGMALIIREYAYSRREKNWNLTRKRTAFVGADALIGPQENPSDFLGIPANS